MLLVTDPLAPFPAVESFERSGVFCSSLLYRRKRLLACVDVPSLQVPNALSSDTLRFWKKSQISENDVWSAVATLWNNITLHMCHTDVLNLIWCQHLIPTIKLSNESFSIGVSTLLHFYGDESKLVWPIFFRMISRAKPLSLTYENPAQWCAHGYRVKKTKINMSQQDRTGRHIGSILHLSTRQ